MASTELQKDGNRHSVGFADDSTGRYLPNATVLRKEYNLVKSKSSEEDGRRNNFLVHKTGEKDDILLSPVPISGQKNRVIRIDPQTGDVVSAWDGGVCA